MTGRAGAQKQQRIFLPHGIRFLDLAEKAGRIAELRLELRADLISDFVATALNSGADSGFQVARTAAEAANHLPDAFFDDALEGAPPAGLEYADGVVTC